MPYEGEFAHYRSIRRLAESEKVKALLGSFETRASERLRNDVDSLLQDDLTPSGWLPKYVLAVDGSHLEVTVRNGFPGAEASYITVACVILDLAKTLALDTHRPVDPVEFRKLERADSIDCALPGCNVVCDEERSPEDSLRRKLSEVLESARATEGSETLLDTYEALLASKPSGGQQCPYDDCQSSDRLYRLGKGEYRCPCALKRSLFSTDALRIHEGMNPTGTNGAMFAEVMQVLERIWIVHVLRTMESKNWLWMLKDVAIVLDGPLAVFGHPAWLSRSIREELQRINNVAKLPLEGKDILILGIEKTGTFVTHFDALDVSPDGASEFFPKSTAALLDDSYIKRNIVFSDSDKPYGVDTYFGRKFLYKTQSGARIVAMVPSLDEYQRDSRTARPDQFPRLEDAMSLLERLVSSRYRNALTPLVSAHAEAAIPLNLGKRVLENLARELIQG